MREDIGTLDTYLPGILYNFHPGSHVGQGIDVGMALIVELLEAILTPGQTTRVLLETMSGKGTEVGSRFEELGHILRSVSLSEKMGVCLDTCHVYSAGYDIVNDIDGVLEQFDRHIGLDKLYAVHLNDSLMPFAKAVRIVMPALVKEPSDSTHWPGASIIPRCGICRSIWKRRTNFRGTPAKSAC